MNMKQYQEPILQIVILVDILTSSAGGNEGNDLPTLWNLNL